MNSNQRVCCLCATLVVLVSILLVQSRAEAKEDGKAIIENVQKYATCIIQSSFSFIYPITFPPKSEQELRQLCRTQSEGFKCVKDKSKGAIPLLRRGLMGYISGRQRHHKKYCTNFASEQSRKFLEASKCIMEKRYQTYRDNDAELIQVLTEVYRRSYNDSAAELKRICCTFYTFKKNFSENIGTECQAHKQMIDELGGTIAGDGELNLICEDEDKLAKSCNKLEPLQFKRVPNFQPDSRLPPSVLAIYLLATLGEPNDSNPLAV